MIALSLGWGRQSTALVFMSAFGDLPMVDAAIHSDTTHERRATYEYAKRWTPFLQDHGVKIVTVRPSRTLDYSRAAGSSVQSVQIPAFTLGLPGERSIPIYDDDDETIGHQTIMSQGGERGVLMRQCTQRWKIAPMRRWLQANRNGAPVEMWLGISADEIERQKPSNVQYITNRFPLLEKKLTVADCEKYLRDHGIEVPVKSSCVFCPFHNRVAWRELRQNGNGDWQKAVDVDEAIRDARPGFTLFVHPDRKPLAQVGDSIDAQPELMPSDECAGACFL